MCGVALLIYRAIVVTVGDVMTVHGSLGLRVKWLTLGRDVFFGDQVGAVYNN